MSGSGETRRMEALLSGSSRNRARRCRCSAELAAKSKKQPKKAAAGGAKKSKKSSGPTVSELIVKAVSASKERSGVSVAALKKVLAAGGYDTDKNRSRVKLGLKALVTKGTLIQVKGSGASGSFKLNKKQAESKDKAAKKKPAAAKPKKAAAKKPAAKSPKKAPTAAKSPKKAKKPAAAAKKAAPKAKKVTKSPAKKAAKPKAAKSPAKKAAKAKKPAAKK
ncbi:histone H1.4-like [Leptodactylus fuscus]|uniref:histone H1.4-like n=1 Tax=Leptodactylus fuscus TaxID=238119 RepID=UPI003F4E4B16